MTTVERFAKNDRVILARSDGTGYVAGSEGRVYEDRGEFVEVVGMHPYGFETTLIGGVLVPRERLHYDRRGRA